MPGSGAHGHHRHLSPAVSPAESGAALGSSVAGALMSLSPETLQMSLSERKRGHCVHHSLTGRGSEHGSS